MMMRLWPVWLCLAQVVAFHPLRHPHGSIGSRRGDPSGWTTAPPHLPAAATSSADAGDFFEGDFATNDPPPDVLPLSALPVSPPLSFRKFLTMQEKRVVVTIQYNANSGLRPYFLTAAKRIKERHPDVVIEKLILPEPDEPADRVFAISVDGKVAVGGKQRSRGEDGDGHRHVFVSLEELGFAIEKARRKKRPHSSYGGIDEGTAVSYGEGDGTALPGGTAGKWADGSLA